MKKKILKPFDIEKAKAGAKICTRDGRKARVICYDAVTSADDFIVVALILNNGVEELHWYTEKGRGDGKVISYDDLMLVEYEEEEFQFKPFDKVLVRDMDNEEWMPAFYTDYDEINECPYLVISCIGRSYKQCIQYEGNEHLVGTTNNPE